MLIKASKSTLRFFKPHFCENPSKLANLVDFVTQKKDVIFWNISGGENIEEKKMSDFCDANFDPMDLFFFLHVFFTIYGE